MSYVNRRQFLSRSSIGVLGATLGLSMLANQSAWARASAGRSGGYKTVVAIMMKGGLDHNDTVLPYDTASYEQLRDVRAGCAR